MSFLSCVGEFKSKQLASLLHTPLRFLPLFYTSHKILLSNVLREIKLSSVDVVPVKLRKSKTLHRLVTWGFYKSVCLCVCVCVCVCVCYSSSGQVTGRVVGS